MKSKLYGWVQVQATEINSKSKYRKIFQVQLQPKYTPLKKWNFNIAKSGT